MSGITKGVVAAVLLAGAVAGAAAFPRFLAGPGGGQTPPIAVPQGAAAPAIVRARPLPVPHAAIKVPSAPIVRVHAAVAARPHILGRSEPIVVRRHVTPLKPTLSPPAQATTPITPAPSPTATPTVAPIPSVTPTVGIGKAVVVTHHSSTPVVPATSSNAPTGPVVAPSVHVGPTPVQHGHGTGTGKNGKQNQPRVVAVVAATYTAAPAAPAAPALGSSDGQSTPQVAPGPVGGGSGHVGHLETPYPGSAPSGHDHGPASWTDGRDQGR